MRFIRSRHTLCGNQQLSHDRPRSLLAFAVIVLFALVVLAALLTPGADVFDQLLPLIGGLLVLVVRYYFGQHRRK